MAQCFIGIGSNVGDRNATMRRALESLAARAGIRVKRVSSFIETEPVGGPLQPAYLNAVAELDVSLPPAQVLHILQEIERSLGRVRTVPNGPRTIDLDILLFDDVQMATDALTIPHPRLAEREFVLVPLAEIAPAVAARYRANRPEGRTEPL